MCLFGQELSPWQLDSWTICCALFEVASFLTTVSTDLDLHDCLVRLHDRFVLLLQMTFPSEVPHSTTSEANKGFLPLSLIGAMGH